MPMAKTWQETYQKKKNWLTQAHLLECYCEREYIQINMSLSHIKKSKRNNMGENDTCRSSSRYNCYLAIFFLLEARLVLFCDNPFWTGRSANSDSAECSTDAAVLVSTKTRSLSRKREIIIN